MSPGTSSQNLLLHPDEKKFRKVKIQNVHFQERLGHIKGSLDCMHSIGYVHKGEYMRLESSMAKG